MAYIAQKPEQVKTEIARQLAIAERAADAYNGPGDRNHFRGHGHFDFEDVLTGELLHDVAGCPYCRLRKLQRLHRKLNGVSRHVH